MVGYNCNAENKVFKAFPMVFLKIREVQSLESHAGFRSTYFTPNPPLPLKGGQGGGANFTVGEFLNREAKSHFRANRAP